MISERLKEVRDALGLSQQAMADQLGVSLRSQQNYEAGKRTPDAEYLAALAEKDVDIQYVLTGRRSVAGTASATAELPPGEQLLLEAYRDLPVAKQKQLLADLLVGNAGKKAARKMDAGSGIVIATGKRSQAAGRDIVNSPRKE